MHSTRSWARTCFCRSWFTISRTPHAQKENEGVFWGYCLFPRKDGDYVKKPFIEMTGREMLGKRLSGISRHSTRAVRSPRADRSPAAS